MKFFDKVTSFFFVDEEPFINASNNTELAYQAFKTFGMGGQIDDTYKKPVEKFLRQFDSRIASLKGIAELCGDDKSPKALYIKFSAYVWAGASCRKEAIKYGNEYLEGEIWFYLPNDEINIDGFTQSRWKSLLSNVWMDLGKAYEGEYEFENALNAYKKALELSLISYGYNLSIANIYRKMNDLDAAIQTLEKAKENPLLKPRKYKISYENGYTSEYISPDYSRMFDKDLEDYQKKKSNGYKYKPRKSIS